MWSMATSSPDPAQTYATVQKRLTRGWNTFNVYSVLSHVLLPHGFSINFGIKEYREGGFLASALIGRQGADVEVVRPGPRTCDGSYTQLEVSWRGIKLTIETAATIDDDF